MEGNILNPIKDIYTKTFKMIVDGKMLNVFQN